MQDNMEIEQDQVQQNQQAQESNQEVQPQMQVEVQKEQVAESMNVENQGNQNIQSNTNQDIIQDMHIEVQENQQSFVASAPQVIKENQVPESVNLQQKQEEEAKSQNQQNQQNLLKIPIPSDFDFNSVSEFVKGLKWAGRLTEEEFKYLLNVSISLKYDNIRVQQAGTVLDTFKQILEQDSQIYQQNTITCFSETAAAQMGQEFNLSPEQQQQHQQYNQAKQKSFMVKQGDKDEIKHYQDQMEAKQPAIIQKASGTVSDNQQISREEMEAQRRQRYAQVEKDAEKRRKDQEDQLKKQQATEAFWKRGGKGLGQF